jgi:hypothetical protein
MVKGGENEDKSFNAESAEKVRRTRRRADLKSFWFNLKTLFSQRSLPFLCDLSRSRRPEASEHSERALRIRDLSFNTESAEKGEGRKFPWSAIHPGIRSLGLALKGSKVVECRSLKNSSARQILRKGSEI